MYTICGKNYSFTRNMLYSGCSNSNILPRILCQGHGRPDSSCWRMPQKQSYKLLKYRIATKYFSAQNQILLFVYNSAVIKKNTFLNLIRV